MFQVEENITGGSPMVVGGKLVELTQTFDSETNVRLGTDRQSLKTP